MAASPNTYIGNKISLISNAGIRYEGILYNIDTQESTVALSNVRAFGTEGRKPGGEVVSSDEIYDYIVFRGKDIQDLTVSDACPPDDPAIVAINPLPSPTSQGGFHGGHPRPMGGAGHNQPGNFMMSGGPGRSGGQASVMSQQHGPGGGGPASHRGNPFPGNQRDMYGTRGVGMSGRHLNQSGIWGGSTPGYSGGGAMYGMMNVSDVDMMRHGGYQPNYMARRGRYSYRGGRGGYSGGPNRVIGELSAQPNQSLKSQVESAFDFDEANRKFDKTFKEAPDGSVMTEGGKENNEKGPGLLVYDKQASFFDRISCETLDRQAGHESRIDRNKQRQLDLETFGQAAANPIRRGGGGGRGYRRGGGGMMVNNMVHTGIHTGGYNRPSEMYGGRF